MAMARRFWGAKLTGDEGVDYPTIRYINEKSGRVGKVSAGAVAVQF